jgi:hypothetical protein
MTQKELHIALIKKLQQAHHKILLTEQFEAKQALNICKHGLDKNAYMRQYYASNKDKIKKRIYTQEEKDNMKARQATPEYKQLQKDYYLKNKERILEEKRKNYEWLKNGK